MTRSPLRVSLLTFCMLAAAVALPFSGLGGPSIPAALAATYRNLVAQVPASPYASDTVHVWVNSDTAFGETAALEYRIGTSYTQVNCTYDTSYNGADWRCDIPAQSAGTNVSYQLFTYNQSNQPYGYTGFNWQYTVQADNNIHWNGLFADQSPFFMSPVQPTQGGNLTIRFRTQHSDVSSVNLQWYDSGNPNNDWNNSLSMTLVGQDATGGFDIWSVDASALLSTSATKYYRFQAIQGNATTYFNANGPTCGNGNEQSCQAPTSESFWLIPGFSTPAWSQSAIFYQIFPDRFRNGNPTNDIPFKANSQQDPSCPTVSWNYDANNSLCYNPSATQQPPCPQGWNEDTTQGRTLCYDPANAVAPNPCPAGSYAYGGTCAYTHTNWNELPQQGGRGVDFFGGDLAGVNQEIDPYLKQTLGVNALYLNPIFQSPSNHKYDTQDYYSVDPHFGVNTGPVLDSLTSLIGTAHSTSNFNGDQRMSVMLDGVFNHTGDWNCYFNRPQNTCNNVTGAWQDPVNSPYASWYKFLPGFNQQTAPNNYCAWSGFGSLPQLNYSSQAVRDQIYATSGSVMQSYLTAPYNVDGWRLDVADNYSDLNSAPQNNPCQIGVDNHQIWQQIRPDVKAANSNALILAEYWQKPTDWLAGDQWDSVMNYNGFNVPVSRFFTGQNVHGEPDGYLTPSSLAGWLRGTLADNNRSSQLAMLNSLTTHDTSRFLYRACTSPAINAGSNTCLSSGSTPQSAIDKLKMATELQMTYVGMPSIYYGDEIGTTGANDPDNRRTFDWNTANWNTDVLSTTRTLIANRQAHPAFQNGTFQVLLTDDANDVLAYGRAQYALNNQNTTAPTDAGIVVLNNDANSHQETIDASQLSLTDGTQLTDILTGNTYTVQNGQISITLAGNTGAVLVTGSAASPSSLSLPGTPSNVAVQRAPGQATLTWNPPASGGPVYGYTVTPSPTNGLTVGAINCDSPVSPQCSVTITGIAPATPYSFNVAAYNLSGAGQAGNASLGAATVPAAPAAILGVPGDGQVSVAWKAPPSDGNSAITSYTVSCQPSCANPLVLGNQAFISGLTNGTPYTVSVVANNGVGPSAATSTTVTPASLSVRYSNPLSFAATARDGSGHPLAVTETGTLPAGLTVSGGSTGTATVAGTVTSPAGNFSISFSAPVAALTLPATIHVTPEIALVQLASTNYHAVSVTGNATTAPITLTATVTDNPDGHPGIITRALPLTFTLHPAAGGSPTTCIASTGTLVHGAESVRCTFKAGIPVGAYEVHVSTPGTYYTGSADSALAIYNTKLGGASGGGTVTNPVTGAKADVALSVQRVNGVLHGGFVYVEHRAGGDVVLTSTSLSSLGIVTGNHGALPRSATIGGAGTLTGTGAVTFTVTANDGGDPNSVLRSDSFRLQTDDNTSTPISELTYSGPVTVPYSTGNLFVGMS